MRNCAIVLVAAFAVQARSFFGEVIEGGMPPSGHRAEGMLDHFYAQQSCTAGRRLAAPASVGRRGRCARSPCRAPSGADACEFR